MSLSSALLVAQSSLTTSGLQSSVVSRNIAGQSDPNFNRKSALLVTGYGGAVEVAGIGRAADSALFTSKLKANAAAATQTAIVDGLTRLDETVNDPELNQSLAAKLGDLTNALQQYSVQPDDPILAQSVLTAATDMAVGLNQASDIARTVREQADADMANGVGRINDLLTRFEEVNDIIVKGSRSGADISDALDNRDRILSELSQEIGISTVTRSGNDTVIYTDSGVTLFETVPRTVSMTPSFSLPAGTAGQAVYIDGVPVTGAGAIMPITSGRIYGASVVRDQIGVTYQRQIDEIARGLIEVFAESDQSAIPTLPDATGLFTWPGAPAIPPTGTTIDGLASSIRVDPAADPGAGGNLDLLRDGGFTGPAYGYNATGAAGFSDRIQQLLTRLGEERNFDPATEADPTNSLSGFASSSVGWLQAQRQTSDQALGYQNALLERTTEALSNVTGVNVDEEMVLLMELERSYNASSTLITTIDRMFDALLSAVR